MEKSNALAKSAELSDDVRQTVNDLTTRLVNQAVDHRLDQVVSADKKTREIGERLWRQSVRLLVVFLLGAIGWLLFPSIWVPVAILFVGISWVLLGLSLESLLR